jgi:hypothetical protein
MASEITKVSVVDSRILQQKPKFAVEKGPLSLTNVPYRSITASQSQMTFNIIVPSESVFIDRAVDWQSTVYGSVDVTVGAVAFDAKYPILVYGRDCALAPFPLHQLCATMSATINDTTTVVNTSDVANTLLRLVDYKRHRKVKTCPNMLDKYYKYPSGANAAQSASALSLAQQTLATNSPLAAFGTEKNVDEKPNGSWGDFQWTDSDGSIPAGTFGAPVAVSAVANGTITYNFINGQPVAPAGAAPADVYRLYFRFKSTERLLISPFIFADDNEVSTGLFGIQNMQLLMNFQNPLGAGRLLRCNNNAFGNAANTAVWTVGNQQFQNVNNGSCFGNPLVNVQYLTPSLDVPLPAKNIVPYMDYPRYISQQSIGTIPFTVFSRNVGASVTGTPLNSQTITLPAIPDLLAIYVKPNTISDPTQGDWVLPVTGISVNFDNYAGLLSSHSQEQLYRMSVRNGLEMDFDQWRGYANAADGAYTGVTNNNGQLALSGGPLLLKPGRDIVLQAGQAPSLVGNFSLQFTLNVQNQTGVDQSACQIYVIAINSGYLETIKGSSRIIKGVLTEQDILSAPMGPGSSDAHMGRLVGSGQISEAAEHMGHQHKKHGKHHKKMSNYY